MFPKISHDSSEGEQGSVVMKFTQINVAILEPQSKNHISQTNAQIKNNYHLVNYLT